MNCRACTAKLPSPFLDLGTMPLANSYVHQDAIRWEQSYPLAVAYCLKCHLVQLTETIDPEHIFSDYAYSSSYSTTYLAHAEKMSQDIIREFLPVNGKVLEVGSNDGYLLQYFKRAKHTVLGVEPATNIADKANKLGLTTLNLFFGTSTVPTILNVYGHFDIIIGNNVMAHVPEINDFLQAVNLCLTKKGVAIFEVPYLPMLLQKSEFDTIYHEHVFYYSVLALKNLFARNNLEIFDIKFMEIHGGSLRIFASHANTDPVSSVVSFYDYQERLAGLDTPDAYADFGDEVEFITNGLRGYLKALKESGSTIAAYGAPAKGNTLLNATHIGSEFIDFTVDRNPDKQGLMLPGSHIPILPPEELVKRRPDYCLILPWNFADEIQEQQAEYINQGGKFMTAIPVFRVLN